MSLKHWLETLRVPFRRTRNGRIPRQRSRYSPTAVSASERLEERALLTANLFVDFGDRFPAGTLVTTEGAFRDIAVPDGPDNAILGPQLEDTTGYNPATALHVVAQSFTSTERAQMLATVIRAYQPLDVNVVELTAAPVVTADGRIVSGATSMADVITTLRGGNAAWKDAYVFVGRFIADPGGPNQVIYGPSGGGTSPVNGLDISDLNSGQNLHDDVAVVFTDTSFGYNFNTMNNIAHEAGHNFGLQHSLTNESGTAATDLLHRSELMSYLNTNFTTSSIAFSRYPVIRGDDNSPEPPATLVNYDDLEARGVGNLTPFDQLATDPTIGPNPDYFFVSGTGAHDVITLTKNGLNADITVTAYADAARTTGIPVPGVTTPGNTYSYSIPLSRPILVYAGYSDDRIEIYGDLGVTVTVDGMLGTDSLFVSTGSSIGAVWTPRTTAPAGVDFNGSIFVPDYGGAVTFGTTTIQLNNFETTSSLEFTGVTNVSVEGSTGNDTLQLRRSTLGGIQQVTGTLGVVSMIPVTLTGASSVQIDGLAGSDQLTVDNTNGIITIPITWNGGSGGVLESDTLRVLGGSFTTIRSTFTNVNDGTLNLDTNTISYTGLEPVLLNVGSVTNIIFDLPAIANPDVIIRDDGFAPDPNGNTANTSSIDGSTFEFTEFTNPTTSLQVNGALAFSNTVTLAVLDSLWGSASVELNGGNIADTFNIQATPSGTTTVNAGTGIDQFVISGDGLSGTSLFRGDADNDEFLLNIISHIGATAVSGPTVSVQIEGNANPLANSANRDRLTINDSNEEFVRNLIYDFLDTQGDLDILAGALNAGLFGPEGAGSLALNVRTMETLRFNSSGTADDIVAITGRSVDDDLTVALTPTVAGQTVAGTSAFVFLNGTPYTGSPGATSPPDTLSANFPGIAGGGNGTDLLLNGIAAATGLTVDGSGSSLTGNRVIVQAISETNLTDAIALAAALDVFNLGLGAGVLVPGAGGGNGFDAIAINGSTTLDVDMGTVTSAINQVLARNILSGPLVPVTVVPASLLNGTTPGARSGLIVNGGDEILARASGIADNFTASPHPLFNIGVNGNLPVSGAISADGFLAGDQLILISPAAFSLWSDKLPLPNVSIFAGNNPHGIVSTSMERTRLFPGNGTVNLIGDQNNPLIDQTDRFRVIGLDVDTNGSLDAGVQEMMVTVNQSAPILIDGVQKLNVYGYDLTGQDLNNPNPNAADISVGLPAVNIDTLEITPFADNAGGPGLNAPRGWGVQTVFNEGSPNGVDGDAADLLVVHTSIGVNHGMDIFGGGIISDQVAVRPSGPDNGEVRITNAVDGSMVATISFVNNTDLILVDDDESLSDSDSLILYGTDSGAQVSGNDSFDVDFEAAGTLESPMVTVRDSDTAQILYRLRGFTSPTFGTGTFTSVSFDMLGGNDSMRIKSGLLAVQPNNGFAVGMSQLTIQGGVGDDSLTLNYTTSEDWRGGRVTYDGGAGADVLSFVDDTGQQIVGFGPQIPFTTVTYTPGPTAGSGRIEHLMQGSNESAILDFRQLEPVFDFTTAATLIINANNADNAISYYTDFGVGTLSAITAGGAFTTDGVYLNVPLTGGTGSGARADFTVVGGTVTLVTLVNDGIGYSLGDSLSVNPVSLGGGAGGFTIPVASFSGTVAVDNQEVLVFSNKTNLQINGLGGSDFISLNNPITPNGLTGIAVNGGDPTGSDTLLVNGIAGAFDNFQIAPISIGSGLVNSTTSAVVPVTFSATEHLQIVGQSPDGDQLNHIGTGLTDTFVYTPGTTADAGTLTGQASGISGFAFTPVTFRGILGAVTTQIETGDVLNIDGTTADDTFQIGSFVVPFISPVTSTGVRVDTGSTLHAPVFAVGLTPGQIVLRGLQGNDTFQVTFNSLASIGLGTALRIEGGGSDSSSDTVNYTPALNATTTVDFATSTVTSTGANGLTISGVENLNILGSNASLDQFVINNFGAPTDVRQLNLNAGDTAGADDLDTIDVSMTSGSESVDYIPQSSSDALLRGGNGGPQIHVISLNAQPGDLTLNGNGGLDQVNVIASTGNDLIQIGRIATQAVVVVSANGNPTGGTVWVPLDFDITSAPGNIDRIQITGGAGDDLLRIDNSGGLLALATGIGFDGGLGTDALQLIGSTAVTTAVYSVGPNTGDGRIVHTLSGTPNQVQDVQFTGLEPVIDLVVAASLTVNATNADNAINYTVGPNNGLTNIANPTGLLTGLVSIDGFEPIEFSNKTSLTLNGLAGSDFISLNNPITPNGLTGIIVDGGDPTGSDTLLVNGIAGTFDNFQIAPISIGSGLVNSTTSAVVPVTFSATEHLQIVGQSPDGDQLNHIGTGLTDTFVYTPGTTADAGTLTGQASGISGFAFTPVTFRGILGAVTTQIETGDVLNIDGTTADDTFQIGSFVVPFISPVTSTGVRVDTGSTLHAPVFAVGLTPGQIVLRGLQGNDTFQVTFNPLASIGLGTALRIEGGGSDSSSDTVNYTPALNATTTVDFATSTVTSTGANGLTISGVENLNILGSNASLDQFVINNFGAPTDVRQLNLHAGDTAGGDDGDAIDVSMTSGADTVDYIPQSSSDALLRGVNGGPQIHVMSLNAQPGDLTLNGNGGLDQVNVIASTGNDLIQIGRIATQAVVVVSANGNPTGGTVWVPLDFDITSAPGNIDRIQITGGAGDDLLRIDNSGGLLALATGIGFDGGLGTDALQLIGSTAVTTAVYSVGPNTGDGRIVHTLSGTPNQVQDVQFTGLEPVIDLVVAASLTVNATNAVNAISYTVGPNSGLTNIANPTGLLTGLVSIDGFEPIEFSNKTALILNGLAGSDQISLNSAVVPAGLTGITVNGGDPTIDKDTILISGTTGGDSILFSATSSDSATITGAGPTSISVATAEFVQLDGRVGSDNLTYQTPVGGDIVHFASQGNDQSGVITATRATGTSLIPVSFRNIRTSGLPALFFQDVSGTRSDALTFLGSETDESFQLTVGGQLTVLSSLGLPVAPVISTPGILGLTLQGLSGDDSFQIPGNHPYLVISVEGGNPGVGSDSLNFIGSGGAITMDLGGGTITESLFNTVLWSGIELATINAATAALRLLATTGNDTTEVIPTSVNSGTLRNNSTSPLVNFTNTGSLTVDQLTGDDVLKLQYTTGADTIAVNVPAALISGGSRIATAFVYANTESVRVFGQEGNDTFNVTTDPNIPIFIDGGDPIGTTPGDVLNILSGGPAVVFEPGPESDEGGFIEGSNERVSFDHIEGLAVIGSIVAFISGTGADDDITIIARDVSTHVGADGVQDFTIQVNAGPQILWIDTPVIIVNALAGDDDIVLRAPAPNDANWNVSVYISGGAPAAGPFSKGDRFVLETPQLAADNVLYTPTGVDSGVIIIDEAGNGSYTPATDTRIQLGKNPVVLWPEGLPIPDPGGIETFVYDGEAGDDLLSVIGDGSGAPRNDIFTHTPGTEPDDGFVIVNSLLGVHYTDLGLSGSVNFDGLAGVDVLSVVGTDQNDVFGAAGGLGTITHTLSSGQSRVPLNQANLERIVLEGLNGDDTFLVAGNAPVALQINGGTPSVGSDVVNFLSTGATIVDLGASTIDDDGVNPPADVTYTGIETINVTGAGFGLTVRGTITDDVLTYIPQGPNSGRIQANSVAPVVNFAGVSAFGVSALNNGGDVVVVQGTTNHDVITVNSPTRTVTVTNAAGTVLQPVVLNADVETVRIEAGLGNDTIVVVPGLPVGSSTPAPQSLPTNLLVDVDGGPPSASDALVIAGTVAGGTLPATDFVVQNKSRTPDSGRIRVFRNTLPAIVPLPDISYSNVEIVAPLVFVNADPTIGPQLLQQGPDMYEQNESYQGAAFLGSGETINVQNLAIFPDLNEHPFVPNDIDFFRVTAKHTGTMDFQVFFNTWNGLLPGGGDLDIRVLDSNGTLIAGPGSALVNSIFGVANAANPTETPAVVAGNNPDERIRIPVIAGQSYFLQVFNPTQTRFNTNAYSLTVTNTPAPIPYDIEVNDALVSGAVTVGGVPVGLNTQFTVPVALFNPTPGFYVGKDIQFLTGNNAGLALRITAQAPGGVLSVATAGLRGPILIADGFQIESTDSGRSQNDNITRDNTPLIIFRLDDDLLQNDLPGNPGPGGPTPDQPTRIPWNNTFTSIAGPSVGVLPPGDPGLFLGGSVTGQTAGYRVAVYEEGTPTTPGGPGPNGLWGYATMIAPGVYQFNFGNSTTNNLFGPLALTNGSHFLTARVEMIDPAAAPGPANVQARGIRSQSMELIVDAVPPLVAFGDLISIIDGLHPTSDSSVSGVPLTISDRVTNDTTPTLFGTAEANSIVRAYLDVDASGTISGPDILLGQGVAAPLDGTNQAPFGQWILTSTVDLNSPVVLAALGSARDGLRRLLISAEDVAGNMAVPAGLATPQQLLNIFIDTQGPQITDPDAGGALQAIQIANPAPLGPVNGINSFNLFATKPANAAQGPTPLVNGLIINIVDLPSRVQPFVYAAIQNPALAGPIIAPLASVSPTAGAPAIAGLVPIPIPLGAVALNPADFSVVGDANGSVTILSAWFVSTTPVIPPTVPATGYIVLTFRSATAGESLPDDRFTLTVSDKLTDPANNRLDGENQGISLPGGILTTPTGDGQPGASFVARFTVDSRVEAATFGQGGISVDANGNWKFDPNNTDPANRDLTFSMGIDTDFIFTGKHSAAQTVLTRTSNGYDKLGAYGKLGGAFRWLLDTTDDGVTDITVPQATGFTVSGITFTGNGIPFAGNFAGVVGSADEVAIFDGINWFLDTAAPFNVITAADTAFAGAIRGLPIAGDFDGDGLTDLATHYASANRFQFDYAATGGLTGAQDALINYGFSGVLERPVAGDLNLDGITDIGIGVPNQDGLSTNTTLSWYILQSVGPAAPGTNANLNHAFSPIPVGPDMFRQFGNKIAIPMLGNFDPPPVAAANSAPVLTAPQFVNTPESVRTSTIAVSASDANGDQVTVSASADSIAWYLKSSLGLRSTGNYNENWGGRGEKWIQDSAKRWYYITPSGALYRWDLRAVKVPTQLVTGTLIEILDPKVHANPALLTNAVQTTVPVTATISGNSLTVTRDAGFNEPFVVMVRATDGVAPSSRAIRIESATRTAIRLDKELGLSQAAANYSLNWGGLNEKWLAGSGKQWYFITPDGTLRVWDRSKFARGEVVAQLDPMFHQQPSLLVNASVINLDQTYGFKSTGSVAMNWGGKKEKWFQDAKNLWYFILPNGEIRLWDGKAGANGELVSLVDTSYYTNPVRVFKALDDVFSDWMGLFD